MINHDRHYTFFDKLVLGIDEALRALNHYPKTSGHPNPSQDSPDNPLSDAEKKHAAGLMRVNHAGEICAQALYHGQGIISRDQSIQEKMRLAAIEEGDHLVWCKQRLDELGSHTSYLNPIWYAGSFCIGMVAGMVGDEWSLGFVAETEKQVIKHLQEHLSKCPVDDERSYQILTQMEKDEAKHRDEAIQSGARELPPVIQKIMRFTSKIMVKTAYYF